MSTISHIQAVDLDEMPSEVREFLDLQQRHLRKIVAGEVKDIRRLHEERRKAFAELQRFLDNCAASCAGGDGGEEERLYLRLILGRLSEGEYALSEATAQWRRRMSRQMARLRCGRAGLRKYSQKQKGPRLLSDRA